MSFTLALTLTLTLTLTLIEWVPALQGTSLPWYFPVLQSYWGYPEEKVYPNPNPNPNPNNLGKQYFFHLPPGCVARAIFIRSRGLNPIPCAFWSSLALPGRSLMPWSKKNVRSGQMGAYALICSIPQSMIR